AASGFDGRAHSGWVMRKIIDDKNSVVLAFDVETAAHGAEGGQRFLQGCEGDASSLRDDDGGERVQYIVAARSGKGKFAESFSVVRDAKLHRIAGKLRFAGNLIVVSGKALVDAPLETFASGFAHCGAGSF